MNNFDFAENFKHRTKKFALRIIKLCKSLSRSTESQVIGRQLVRSGTSMAANYRAACRARSHAEFYSKMNIVVEEADESLFWLEILYESGIFKPHQMNAIIKEAKEILSIVSAARKTAKPQ